MLPFLPSALPWLACYSLYIVYIWCLWVWNSMLWAVAWDLVIIASGLQKGKQLLAVNIGGDVLLAEIVPYRPTDGQDKVELVGIHVNRNQTLTS
jgi:hypothetical protein